LRADPDHRIERCHRILGDESDPSTAQAPIGGFGQSGEFGSAENDPAGKHPAPDQRQQSHHA
jgi:hypothetical protein